MKSLDNVVFCDNHILVVNKPSDLLTQPDDTGAVSLEDLAKAYIKKAFNKSGNVFLHAIHRLDKPVSGLVLFARTSKALSRLNEQMREQQIQRIYVAEVEGILPIKEGKLDHFLIHSGHRALIAKEGMKDAKHARLVYKTVKELSHSTIVEIELETGRYHQIRAQFMQSGHSIVGDEKYGSKTKSSSIHLHCYKIAFKHPVTQEILQFTSAPPFA
jgi:23S rRNA pseudouridine1911/1915/1917 synthase